MILFFRKIIYLFKIDFHLLHEMQKSSLMLKNEKKRIEQEMRFMHSKKDREINFEKKARISLKVRSWHNKNEFSDDMVREAERIQQIINCVFLESENRKRQKFEKKNVDIIETIEKPKEVIKGLGGSVS